VTLNILTDGKVEEHYMTLPELGKVLHKLGKDLPGALCSSALRVGIKLPFKVR